MTIKPPLPQDLAALGQLWRLAFGDSDAFVSGFFATGFSPERCLCLFQEDSLSAALYWFDCRWQDKKVAYLYAIATHPDHRGKGLCRKLMEATRRHLENAGYQGAALVPATEALAAMYEKMGYIPCCQPRDLPLTPGQAVDLTPLTPEKYLERLPVRDNALVHTGAALEFFDTYGGFWQTGNALIAAAREKDTLYIQDFSGDPALLGGIVTALGARQGVLVRPALLYLPLDRDSALPDSFSIPLN